jgi:Glycosyl transferases group 1
VTREPQSLALAMSTTGDPRDPTASSGLPTSLLGAPEEIVDRVVPISDHPSPQAVRATLAAGALLGLRPPVLSGAGWSRERLRRVGEASQAFAAVRARTVRARLRGVGELDGFIQYGGDYAGPSGLRMVTYQDSTVAQAVRSYDWPHLRGLSQRDLTGLIERQRRCYRSAAGCCTISHWAAQSIVSDYGIPAEKVHVVGLGANHELAPPEEGQRSWSPPRFLFVGVDWQRKNGEAVLDAFKAVRERFPEATLDLIGGHPRLSLEGVTGHGLLAMDDPSGRALTGSLFRNATAFVLPSIHEPSATVHVEAGAAGIPSIGTTRGGSSTCIGDGGFVVDPDRPEQLLHAMLSLCNPDTAARLGRLAGEHAGKLTWRKAAERLIRALEIPDLDLTGLADYL